MRIQANGKVRRTVAEWEAIFEEFEGGEQSVAAFCRGKRLPKSTFSKRYRSRARKPVVRRAREARFVELTPAPASRPPNRPITEDHHSFELELPGGVVLRWKV